MSAAQVHDQDRRFFEEMYEVLKDSILMDDTVEVEQYVEQYHEGATPRKAQTIEVKYHDRAYLRITHYDRDARPFHAEAEVRGPGRALAFTIMAEADDARQALESLKAKAESAVVSFATALANIAKLISKNAIRSNDRITVSASIYAIDPYLVMTMWGVEDLAELLKMDGSVKRKVRAATRKILKAADKMVAYSKNTWHEYALIIR